MNNINLLSCLGIFKKKICIQYKNIPHQRLKLILIPICNNKLVVFNTTFEFDFCLFVSMTLNPNHTLLLTHNIG